MSSSVPSVAVARDRLKSKHRKRRGIIKQHRDLILALPGPEYSWAWEDLDDHIDVVSNLTAKIVEPRRLKLKQASILERVGKTIQDHTNSMYRAYEWSVAEDAYQFAEALRAQYRREGSLFPCGHGPGFRTIDADEGVYECCIEWCDEQYDRKTVEGVIQ